MTKKSIPNIISAFRIVVGGAMLTTQAFSWAFYVLYLIRSSKLDLNVASIFVRRK